MVGDHETSVTSRPLGARGRIGTRGPSMNVRRRPIGAHGPAGMYETVDGASRWPPSQVLAKNSSRRSTTDSSRAALGRALKRALPYVGSRALRRPRTGSQPDRA